MRHCVYCERNDAAARDVSLHQFPKDEAILSVWIQNMGFGTKWRPLRSQYLCSKHFLSKWLVGKRLKKGSIPTIFENNAENNVSYEKFKIKNEEIDIDDEFAMKEEFNINCDPDIKSIEIKGNHEMIKVENEEVDVNDEYEVNGEYNIKRDWDIKSKEVNESYEVKLKEEGDKFEIIEKYNIMSDWDIKSGEEGEIYEVMAKEEVDVNVEFDVNVKVENMSDKEVAEPNEIKHHPPTSVSSEASSASGSYSSTLPPSTHKTRATSPPAPIVTNLIKRNAHQNYDIQLSALQICNVLQKHTLGARQREAHSKQNVQLHLL